MTRDQSNPVYGFIGLGNMGGPMAVNLAKAGFAPVVHDAAGTEDRAPERALPMPSNRAVAQAADTIFLSVPDGAAVAAVLDDILDVEDRRAATVIDLSTVGIAAAKSAFARCADAGATYVDCPVSGGRKGAIEATIAAMWAGPADLLEAHRPALEALAGNIFHVGEKAGQGQTLKLLNNFLSATATAATSEAVLFGQAQGLDMKTILDVVNVSTGESRSSRTKFVEQVLTGAFASGFETALMAKDLALYAESVAEAGTAARIGMLMAALWTDTDTALPGSDHMEVYRYLAEQ